MSVMTAPSFRTLSGSATKLLLLIYGQYNGYNNGDLQATFTLAKQWGIRSEATLARALGELIDSELILRTRLSAFLNPGRKCALYAVTWKPIDECKGKLDVAPTRTPPILWAKHLTGPLQKMKPQAAKTAASGPPQALSCDREATETDTMEEVFDGSRL